MINKSLKYRLYIVIYKMSSRDNNPMDGEKVKDGTISSQVSYNFMIKVQRIYRSRALFSLNKLKSVLRFIPPPMRVGCAPSFKSQKRTYVCASMDNWKWKKIRLYHMAQAILLWKNLEMIQMDLIFIYVDHVVV